MFRFICVLLVCVLASAGCRYVEDAQDTLYNETKASALLRKYEWFKDAAASLDARDASIQVYEKRFDRLKSEYEGKSRSQWSREDREQANLWEQEVAGMKASFNQLAADYNAAMAKENWRFCNAGTLPAGAAVPLPRAFRAYEVK